MPEEDRELLRDDPEGSFFKPEYLSVSFPPETPERLKFLVDLANLAISSLPEKESVAIQLPNSPLAPGLEMDNAPARLWGFECPDRRTGMLPTWKWEISRRVAHAYQERPPRALLGEIVDSVSADMIQAIKNLTQRGEEPEPYPDKRFQHAIVVPELFPPPSHLAECLDYHLKPDATVTLVAQATIIGFDKEEFLAGVRRAEFQRDYKEATMERWLNERNSS